MIDDYMAADMGDTVEFAVADLGTVRGEVVYVEDLPTSTDMDVETESARWTLQCGSDGDDLNAVIVEQSASDADVSGGEVTAFAVL